MRKINCIVIHCSASADGIAKTREQLVAEHRSRGFRTVGYHYIIEPKGDTIIGRKEYEIGAHVEGHNAHSIGVCLVGTMKFTKAQWETLANLVRQLKAKYPLTAVRGHRDFSPDLNHDGRIDSSEWIKKCPNFDVTEWLIGGLEPKKENVLW